MPTPAAAKLPTSGIRSFGYERTGSHTHQGIDLVAPLGSPVESMARGVVTHASSELAQGFSGYGRHVVVRVGDAGPWLLYAHLDAVLVTPGERVTKGQQIGTVGRTCFDRSDPAKLCSAAHLHFEVSPRAYPQASEAKRMDPIRWLASLGETTIEIDPSQPQRPPVARESAAQPSSYLWPVLAGLAAGFALLLTVRSR